MTMLFAYIATCWYELGIGLEILSYKWQIWKLDIQRWYYALQNKRLQRKVEKCSSSSYSR